MRKVFFSFHYERDNWRVSQVRNTWVTKGKADSFLDKAQWEKIKRSGKHSIEDWIKKQMKDTSITIVLIGESTSSRDWVNYEIEQSVLKGNALLGIYIHNIKDREGKKSYKGKNPFKNWCIAEDRNGKKFILRVSEYQKNTGIFGKYTNGKYLNVKTYDWKLNDGYNNISSWVEQAIKNKKW